MARPETYYRSTLQQFVRDLTNIYGSELDSLDEIVLETNELLETEIRNWFSKMDNKDFYYFAGCLTQAFFGEVYDNYNKDINACVIGLKQFEEFVKSL